MSQLGVRTDVGPTSVDAGFRIPTALLQQAAVLHPLAGQAATDRLAMTEPEDGLCSCNDPRERTGCGDAPGVAGALGDGDPGTVLTGGDEVAGGVEPPEPESPEPPRDEPSGAGTVVGVVGSAPVVNVNASPSVNSKERDVRNLTTTSTTVGELTGGTAGVSTTTVAPSVERPSAMPAVPNHTWTGTIVGNTPVSDTLVLPAVVAARGVMAVTEYAPSMSGAGGGVVVTGGEPGPPGTGTVVGGAADGTEVVGGGDGGFGPDSVGIVVGADGGCVTVGG